MVEVGNSSLLVALVMSFFIGAVFALYTGRELAQVGVVDLVGELVGISMSKELAPVMMAILFAGRVGSSMTSEIGSMKIYQELDALHTMRIDPVVFLVMPRMVAICVALPLVVLFSVFIGWGGGRVYLRAGQADRRQYHGFLPRIEHQCRIAPCSSWPDQSLGVRGGDWHRIVSPRLDHDRWAAEYRPVGDQSGGELAGIDHRLGFLRNPFPAKLPFLK
jgi:hypothetical protein